MLSKSDPPGVVKGVIGARQASRFAPRQMLRRPKCNLVRAHDRLSSVHTFRADGELICPPWNVWATRGCPRARIAPRLSTDHTRGWFTWKAKPLHAFGVDDDAYPPLPVWDAETGLCLAANGWVKRSGSHTNRRSLLEGGDRAACPVPDPVLNPVPNRVPSGGQSKRALLDRSW